MTSVITQINRALKRAGRSERLVRARGYWRLYGGDAHRFMESGIYAWDPHAQSFEKAYAVVRAVFEDNGISI